MQRIFILAFVDLDSRNFTHRNISVIQKKFAPKCELCFYFSIPYEAKENLRYPPQQYIINIVHNLLMVEAHFD